MGAPTKRAKIIRAKSDFDLVRLSAELAAPKSRSPVYAWSLADIYTARDQQMRGQFWLPARLAESTRTDDAIHVAYGNRLAPLGCLPVEIVAAKGARGASIANEAEGQFGPKGIAIKQSTIADINGCLVDHGVAFAYNVTTPRPDGSRVDYSVRSWPIEFVRWDPTVRCFKARIDPGSLPPNEVSADVLRSGIYGSVGGAEVPIVHGDGRWIVFAKHELEPFRQQAAILASCLVWARHAFGARDWAKGSVAHGSAKVVGKMPQNVPLQEKDGTLTKQAAAFLELLRSMNTSDAPAGIAPAGSELQFLTNTSSAWQVWSELVNNAEKAAARIYLGTDGTLGAQGGAPGVDISQLFGVATTRVQGDIACIEDALHTGTIEPWCAMNFGDSSLAPSRKYKMPDADAEARRDSYTKRRKAFLEDLKATKDLGIVALTQDYVDELAESYEVKSVPLAALAAPAAPASGTTGAAAPALRSVG